LQYTGSFYPKVSKQGIELTFAVNHLAHFYLVNILKDFVRDKEDLESSLHHQMFMIPKAQVEI